MLIVEFFHHALVRRTDDLARADEFFDPVRAPADDPRDREERRVEFLGDAEHFVNEAAVEVDVRADAFEDVALLGDEFGREFFDEVVHRHVLVFVFLRREFFAERFEDLLPRVGHGVDRVAHSVDQSLMIKDFAVEHLREVRFHLLPVGRVFHVRADVVHHLHDLDVRAAVFRPFQRGKRGRHRRVRVGARRRDDACREGGVVSAAVLHVEDQRRVERLRLDLGVAAVRAEHPEEVLRGGELRIRMMDVHALVFVVMVVGVVAVRRDHREDRDQPDGLADVVPDRVDFGVLVVGRERQDASRHRVHDIGRRGFHDHVPREVGGKLPGFADVSFEFGFLFFVRIRSEQKQVRRPCETELVRADGIDDPVDPVAAVPEFSFAGLHLAVFVRLERNDLRDPGESREDALSVQVTESPIDVVFSEQIV